MSSVNGLTADTGAIESFGETLAPYSADMIAIAQASIRHGLMAGMPRTVSAGDFPASLRDTMASFVTLKLDGELRGCIGTAFASKPLVEDLSHNAFMAAFRDPRFPPLAISEFEATFVEVSVLSPPVPLPFDDEDDLIARLVPDRDGLILEDRDRRGLFLPQVWESLPEPKDFLRHLKEKAGLPDAPLKRGVRAQRFVAAKFTHQSTA